MQIRDSLGSVKLEGLRNQSWRKSLPNIEKHFEPRLGVELAGCSARNMNRGAAEKFAYEKTRQVYAQILLNI